MTPIELDKIFNPKDIESRVYPWWENSGYFSPRGNGKPFSIVIPPPNVTGFLHIGHALNITLQDILIRSKRMQGYRTLWIPGTDHAGIATQNVVEKKLQSEKINRNDLGREAFVQRVWEWKKEYGGRITSQVRRLGASVDWSRERFTMDEGCVKAVLKNFVTLYHEGLIYKGKYIINWCPRCKTALSDVEVNHHPTQGSIWHIRYSGVVEGDTDIIVATTRPETMFGDTAIAVNPDDSRYAKQIGKKVKIPLTDKWIPIIADAMVDKEFGTGAVKVTPAHDFNDFETGRRHQLDPVIVMTEDGKMENIDAVPTAYHGMDRFKCREQLVKDLEAQQFLVKIASHELSIGQCYRCQTVVEPYLSNQWFVNMKKLAGPSIDAVRSGKITFKPGSRWEKLYFDWMENIKDWCISRQIWWGHQVPVWYCEDHPTDPIVQEQAPAQCPKCGGKKLTQDPDVLDTWFSSALWPFETLGWPEKTKELETFYPTSVLITGYDIITFWVSRMIVMGLKQMNRIPFSTVYIHGLVRDIEGKKISKSLGNAVDPLTLIDEYGADALRFSLASACTLGGQDIKFSIEKVEACRNFGNKIWNVSRFILIILQETDQKFLGECLENYEKTVANEWILSLFASLVKSANKSLDAYNFAYVCDQLWEFTWIMFCDWYIEIAKIEKEQSRPVLVYVLVQILKLLHPVMPFISEEIWQKLRETQQIEGLSESLMLAIWPKSNADQINTLIEGQMKYMIAVTREVRNLRKQLGIAPAVETELFLICTSDDKRHALEKSKNYIQRLSKTKSIQIFQKMDGKPDKASASAVEDIEIIIPLHGVIDLNQENRRLSKQVQKLESELLIVQKKLMNTEFISKAPENVIQKIRDRQKKLNSEKELVVAQLKQLS